MMSQFEGVFSVLPTPFSESGSVDANGLTRIIDLFLKAGVSGFTALGVTSETARLTEEERSAIVNIVLGHVSGRVPVVVGTTAEGTHTCIEHSRAVVSAGASAVMVSPPRMPKLNSEAVIRHYKMLSDAVDTTIVVQDYPPISGYAMEPSLLVRIATEIPQARVIKLEDPPTPLKIARIRELPGADAVAIFGGLGGMYLLEELLSGATGAMTGFAFPEILVQVVRHFHLRELEKAKEIFYRYVPLMRFEFQEGIGMAIRKEILRRRGAIDRSNVRSPGANVDPSTQRALDELFSWLKAEGCPWI
ncbi:dihydrodipicolinate synthase family protein [bacterium]|nr:dihydrodipicolinate synthase family protein [bacterium]MCI0603930.1 dihydrodipicolinate synthase family protein [bacterium]